MHNRTNRQQDNPVRIAYVNEQPHFWQHLHISDKYTQKVWLQKCPTPCRLEFDARNAHILLDFWDGYPVWPPDGMAPHQRFGVFGLEPHFGYRTSEEDLRRALLPSSDNQRPAVDVVAFWFSQWPDVEINYAYASGISNTVRLKPDWTEQDRLAAIHRALSSRLRLDRMPPFDKQRYYASLGANQVESNADYRGADVALFISNCDQDIWRTQYLKILLPLLEAMGVEVDSWGDCFEGIGRGRLNDGQGEYVSTVTDPSFVWPMRAAIESGKVDRMDTTAYRQRKGTARNGIKKNEMVHHYKAR